MSEQKDRIPTARQVIDQTIDRFVESYHMSLGNVEREETDLMLKNFIRHVAPNQYDFYIKLYEARKKSHGQKR